MLADADDEEDVGRRAKVVMYLIAKEAKGSGLDADDDEFNRVLWFVTCAGMPEAVPIVRRDDFLSAVLAGLENELPSLEVPDGRRPAGPLTARAAWDHPVAQDACLASGVPAMAGVCGRV